MKKKRKIPAAKFGLEQISNMVENAPEAINLLTNPFQTSTATSGKEATQQSISDILSGAGTGASIGMSIGGPLGAGIGAIGGAAVGLIGKKGQEAEMTSFTDYDEGTLGTGLIGAFSNKKLRKERTRIKNNAWNNRSAVYGTAQLQSDFSEKYGQDEVVSVAYGGTIPSQLVYADDGELINTPYGDINKIPEEGKPTDSNLLNLPEGSRILSNTLKVPGTKKTFAEMGNKLINKKKSKYTDKYSENSQKLNDMNNQIAYDNLFVLQEELKKKKGIKPKTKQLVQAAEDGTQVGRGPYSGRRVFKVKGNEYSIVDPTQKVYKYDQPMGPNAPESYEEAKYFTAGEGPWSYQNTMEMLLTNTKKNLLTPNAKKAMFVSDPNLSAWGFNEGWSKGLSNSNYLSDTEISSKNTSTPNTSSKKTTRSIPQTSHSLASTVDEINPIYMYDEEKAPLEMAPLYRESSKPGITMSKIPLTVNEDNPEDKNTLNWSSLISGISQLAPALSNIFTSNPKSIDANYNPYTNAILDTMRRRRYNINPLLRDISENRAIANYNANQFNTNTGSNLAYALQTAINSNKAVADARAQEQNVNNQYLGKYVNTMNDLGQQWVNTTNYTEDLNRKAQANARNIRRQGISWLSGILQNRELMRNQKNRDDAMLALYKPFLEAGFTTSDLKNMLKYIKKGGNNDN